MGNTELGIIGAGAAGMTAAIMAARNGISVTLIEKKERAGKKILMTGNGKCNLSNRSFSLDDYNSSHTELLSAFFQQFGVADTESFFEGLGLMLKDKNGYLYPYPEQASAVLDVLRYECSRLKVELITETEVVSVQKKEDFILKSKNTKLFFNKLLIACGGMACPKSGSDGTGYRLARQLGHSLVPPVPALVQLRCAEKFLKEIAGIRCDAEITLQINAQTARKERGELQLTDYGISGIPVFQLSRFAAYALWKKKEVLAVLDFLPDMSLEEVTQYFFSRYEIWDKTRRAEEFFTGILNKKLMLFLMKQAAVKTDSKLLEISKDQLRKIAKRIKGLYVTVTDTNHFENAQVSAGGIPLNEVTQDLESRMVPGLYFAGEILDVDGRCGGYNLQWAWTSGAIAGNAAAISRKG